MNHKVIDSYSPYKNHAVFKPEVSSRNHLKSVNVYYYCQKINIALRSNVIDLMRLTIYKITICIEQAII